MRKLFYFTTYYPNRDVQWKTDELKILKTHFDIEVVPFENKKFEYKAEKIQNVKYRNPLFDVFPKINIRKKLIKVIFSRYRFYFIAEAFQKKVFFSKKKLILWTEAAYKILELSENKELSEIFKNADEKIIFYFYWGKETGEIIGFLKTKAKIIVRYHGYDLYEERNNNYIPFRKKQLKNLNFAIFISKQGEEYLKKRYSKIKFKTKLSRLGTQSLGLAKQSDDGVFRIVSCSSVIPLKRVELIAEAVMKLEMEVEWTHIGEGVGFENLKKQTIVFPDNIKINLVGQVSAKEVPYFYVNKKVDLFINTSTTEGLPVSIMEALAAGIPVLATDVGGTSELVDKYVGKLLPADLTSDLLAEEIRMFHNMTTEQKELLRKNAFKTFEKKVDFEKNTQNFMSHLQKIL
ncbi:MAG: glycosyltransferase [Chlorobi bacterium]|nr:glycosyltransferase [Chlorobiota bacterium]